MAVTPLHDPIASPQPDAVCETRTTTCYMCACRCGIRVHLKDGKVRYIEGNRAHPVNKGVICGKGASGIMQHSSPARLRAPMKRVGERGSGEFEEISWEIAIAEVAERLHCELVVNVQGDEPLIEPALIDSVAALLESRPEASMSTAAHPIEAVAAAAG